MRNNRIKKANKERCCVCEKHSAFVFHRNSDINHYSDFPWADKTTGGNDTQDYIYLLSCFEAHRYLNVSFQDDSNITSRAAPTTYAIMYGAKTHEEYLTEDGKQAAWWWLRSPGAMQMTAAEVDSDGSVA